MFDAYTKGENLAAAWKSGERSVEELGELPPYEAALVALHLALRLVRREDVEELARHLADAIEPGMPPRLWELPGKL